MIKIDKKDGLLTTNHVPGPRAEGHDRALRNLSAIHRFAETDGPGKNAAIQTRNTILQIANDYLRGGNEGMDRVTRESSVSVFSRLCGFTYNGSRVDVEGKEIPRISLLLPHMMDMRVSFAERVPLLSSVIFGFGNMTYRDRNFDFLVNKTISEIQDKRRENPDFLLNIRAVLGIFENARLEAIALD